MTKIGLYFGTFNPVHVGHLIIANYMADNTDLDEVWLVVSPQNPLKEKSSLLADYHRLALVRIGIEDNPKLKASDIEFKLPQPNYTVNTLAHLEERFPNKSFSLIMGEDNLKSLHKWKNYEAILEHYSIYVYPRISENSIPEQFINHTKITKVGAPIMEISSTFIRKAINQKKNCNPLLPQKVWDYIDLMNFYK